MDSMTVTLQSQEALPLKFIMPFSCFALSSGQCATFKDFSKGVFSFSASTFAIAPCSSMLVILKQCEASME